MLHLALSLQTASPHALSNLDSRKDHFPAEHLTQCGGVRANSEFAVVCGASYHQNHVLFQSVLRFPKLCYSYQSLRQALVWSLAPAAIQRQITHAVKLGSWFAECQSLAEIGPSPAAVLASASRHSSILIGAAEAKCWLSWGGTRAEAQRKVGFQVIFLRGAFY